VRQRPAAKKILVGAGYYPARNQIQHGLWNSGPLFGLFAVVKESYQIRKIGKPLGRFLGVHNGHKLQSSIGLLYSVASAQ
jgi:hypothetical protein